VQAKRRDTGKCSGYAAGHASCTVEEDQADEEDRLCCRPRPVVRSPASLHGKGRLGGEEPQHSSEARGGPTARPSPRLIDRVRVGEGLAGGAEGHDSTKGGRRPTEGHTSGGAASADPSCLPATVTTTTSGGEARTRWPGHSRHHDDV
jgi:hypothetical protein